LSVRIEDCGVAVAIPLSKQEWLGDIQPRSGREYARFYLQTVGAGADAANDVWEKLYEPREVRPILNSLEVIERLGVEVRRGSSLDDIRALARARTVVIIVAHWRSGMLYPDHLLDPDKFITRLARSSSLIMTRLRDALPSERRTNLETLALQPNQLPSLLADLNRALQSPLLEEDASAAPSPPAFELARNRAALDAECHDVLDVTSGLELQDDTHPAESVATCLDESFDGIVDLMSCFSVVLAERIKRRAPHCQILANREATAPVIRVTFVREVLRSISRSPADYVAVSRAVRERLIA
jgi:hypothetical protein